MLLGRVLFIPSHATKVLLMMLVIGPLGRVSEGGRNWEGKLPQSILLCPDPVLFYSMGFSNDPYLCGSLAFETVRGIQENGVITSTKVSFQHVCFPKSIVY